MKKSVFNQHELTVAEALVGLIDTNPFTAKRKILEQQALGDLYVDNNAAWGNNSNNPNQNPVRALTYKILFELQSRLKQVKKISTTDAHIYQELCMSQLFYSVADIFYAQLNTGWNGTGEVDCYTVFVETYQQLYHVNFRDQLNPPEITHVFAVCYQNSRAFNAIYENIFGSSAEIVRLRSEIWQSIFTHKMCRYRESRYLVMNDVTTLITGPSGTGKELVAKAIAYARYIPFNSKTKQFVEAYKETFFPVHLSALSANLIESELFGHSKGAFTGALQNRVGRLESCSEYGTVFLDEIGEICENVQVKMLRVLQERSFQKLGENLDRKFKGKIIAATNRDLQEHIKLGQFRQDFYYRLCSDIIKTPSLCEQIENQNQLHQLIHFLCKKIVASNEVDQLADETLAVITETLGLQYSWPGNVRELEQCIRNVFIRGSYKPFENSSDLLAIVKSATITANELLNLYCKQVYKRTGSYVKTAEITGLDRRTVKKRVDS